MLVTIDGASGVGKGTLAGALAKHYQGVRLDSGAIYRAAALHLVDLGFNLEADIKDQQKLIQIAHICANLPLEFKETEQGLRVLVAGVDRTDELRLESTGVLASYVGYEGIVRQSLLQRQRDFAQHPVLIAEGRDMGYVVFPDADAKIFLTASLKVQAERRYKELAAKGLEVTFAEVMAQLEERDRMNATRKAAPTKPAEDAVIIETDNLGPAEVLAQAISIIDAKLAAKVQA